MYPPVGIFSDSCMHMLKWIFTHERQGMYGMYKSNIFYLIMQYKVSSVLSKMACRSLRSIGQAQGIDHHRRFLFIWSLYDGPKTLLTRCRKISTIRARKARAKPQPKTRRRTRATSWSMTSVLWIARSLEHIFQGIWGRLASYHRSMTPVWRSLWMLWKEIHA